MAVTVEQFIVRLTQSGLMSAAEVSTFQDSLPPDKRPKDVQQLARALVQHGKLTKYQAQAVYEGKTKGLVFGEYVVLDKLGEGGMGVVLKAQHRRMKRLVAIKILSSAAMKQAGAVERFHREVEAAAKLEHPNIVTAHDAGEHQGMHYLAMQYVDGKDLASIVRDHGPLPVVRQAVEYILQAARGLQYAHSKGIVHRDIKPGNLLLDKEGTVKILDMGLALIAGAEAALGGPERLTATGQVMGTCDYMSPEQALDSHVADHRTDIYALGCTLYRLLTGHPPYQGETLMQILLAHRENDDSVALRGPLRGARRAGRMFSADGGQGAGGPLPVDGRSGYGVGCRVGRLIGPLGNGCGGGSRVVQRGCGQDVGVFAGSSAIGHVEQAEEAHTYRANPAARRPGA